MKKALRRVIYLVLAAAAAANGAAVPSKQAAAASKYNCYLVYASADGKCQNMDENVANTSVKNKKGTSKYTVTLTRAEARDRDGGKAAASKEASIFCVDIKGILKDYKKNKVKISKVVVKCDGKVVKTAFSKMAQGDLQPDSDSYKYRLEIYNVYGEGGTKKHPCAKPTAFKWKKSISVSFRLTLK